MITGCRTCDNLINAHLASVVNWRLHHEIHMIQRHMCVSLWVCFTVSQWAARWMQSPCNDEVRTGSCCYQRGKQRWINYACSRDCAHYDSGKLSVTFCGPRGGYGCTEKAPLTSCSSEGHSCIWTKRCTKSSISLALEVSVCISPRLQCRQFTFLSNPTHPRQKKTTSQALLDMSDSVPFTCT